MIVLDTMDLEARCIVHGAVHKHHWRKEGENHGRCGRGCQPFIPRDLLGMIAEIQSDLPLDHGIHKQPHHREHGQCRNPFRFLQPHRTDGGGILDPAKAWFHRDVLFLVRLEHLGIRTLLGPQGGRQDSPSVRVLSGAQGLWAHAEAIADLNLGSLRLRRTAATSPRFRDTDRFYTIVQGMVTLRPGLAPTPPLASPFVLCNGGLRVGGTGKPAGFNALNVLCNTLDLFSLGGGVGHGRLLGQLAGVHNEKPEFFQRKSSVSVFYCHPTDHTLPVPAPRRLPTRTTRFFEQ